MEKKPCVNIHQVDGVWEERFDGKFPDGRTIFMFQIPEKVEPCVPFKVTVDGVQDDYWLLPKDQYPKTKSQLEDKFKYIHNPI